MTHRMPATCAYVYLFANLVVAHPGLAMTAFDGPGTPTPTEYLTARAGADRVVAPAALYAALGCIA